MSILSQVKQLGQQIWLDNLSRSLVQNGMLAQMLEQGVCGVTSNPAIFQKAFAGDPLYTPEIETLKKQGKTAKEIYETLAVADVQAACDVCRAEFDRSGGKTGFVSLEVSPELSRDSAGTVAEARRLWAAIGRPNAMIKVPATDEGLAALTELVAEGINVNLTLLFSRAQTLKAYKAYVAGIAKRAAAGADVSQIRVVLPRLAGIFRQRGICTACRAGREQGFPAVGIHRRKKSRLSRHALCGQPDRQTHRKHRPRCHAQSLYGARHGRRNAA